MELQLDVQLGHDLVDKQRISKLVDYVAQKLEVPNNAEVSLSFIDDNQMCDLNSTYRKISSTTDVLSFECDGLEDEFTNSGGDVVVLGDIMISPEVAFKQAQELGHSAIEEIDLLVIHGFLHLCGYDHIKDEDAEIMEPLQEQLLTEWLQLQSNI